MYQSFDRLKCYTSFNVKKKEGIHLLFDREDRIRTCDPLVPNQVLYQAELLPDKQKNYAPKRSRTPNLLIRSQTLYPVELWAHVHIMPRTGIEPVR